jgi:hypothetical protein
LRASVFVVLMLLCGCQDRTEAPRSWGRAPCFSADLVARVAPPQGEPETVSVAVDRRDDGRLRVDLSKLDVQAANVLMEPDGACVAWLPRTHRVARAPAGGGADTGMPLIAALRLISRELAEGPATTPLSSGGREGWIFHQEPCDADGRPTVTRVSDADGTVRFTLRYDRWQTFGEVERPARCRLTLADGTIIDLRLRSFRVLGSISVGRFRLEVPEDAETVPWQRLGESLGE